VNPSTLVLQMVRAHFGRDDAAFISAATTLGRGAKSARIGQAIADMCRRGYQQRQGMRQLPPAQSRPPVVADGLLQRLKPITFADLMLEPDLQLFLDEIVTELEYREELAERGLRARSRLLFHGPPGNGKTSAASAMGRALGVQAYGVSLPDVVSCYVGGTDQNLGKLFGSLHPDTLVVFDEIDAIASHRGDVSQSAGKSYNSSVNTLLTLLDRTEHGLIVATTNRIDIIDPALLRRFDEQLYFPAPTSAQMQSLAKRLSEERSVHPIAVSDCENFDAVTKRVNTEARRFVMQQIMAAEAEQEEESDGDEEEDQ